MDLYLPSGLRQAPLVLIAHGFSRSRKNMAGLGRLLASHGFIAAVPDLPGWADYRRNARVLAALLEELTADGLLRVPRPFPYCALVGYSLGGLSALLAATMAPNVRCWIGLDPVDVNGSGEDAARQLRIPSVVLSAEPSPWTHGTRRILRALSSPRFALRVKHASHCDPENPTDWVAQLLCGRANPSRRQIFEAYLIAAVRAIFFGDTSSRHHLAAAHEDGQVSDVVMHKLTAFNRASLLTRRTRQPASPESLSSA